MADRVGARGIGRLLLVLAGASWGCAPSGSGGAEAGGDREGGADEDAAALVLEREASRIDAAAEAIDSIFQPLPLLRPADEEALRRFSNAAQLERARALGVGRSRSDAELEALVAEGRLVRLDDGEHWVLRDLDHSRPLAAPGVHALLTEMGERFHARLAQLGAPPFRMEVTSVLRSAADQEALRRVNPNAAQGESTHEYGTTVDVLYAAFAAPTEPIVAIDAAGADWADEHLRRYARLAAERVAARRAMEIKAVLGAVLLEMQREGKVMVTLERQQPVFHMTLAGQP
ncbi:MAG TPA: DUF5715 family protein [Longimicrobiaceae bacterium]